MRCFKRYIFCFFACMLAMLLPFPAEAARLIVATIFPVAQIAKNVTAGRDGVIIETLLPANTGCPHDYALTPQEMRQAERADLIICLGLGLDDFPGIKRFRQPVISLGNLLPSSELLSMHREEHSGLKHETAAIINPHVFSSPRLMGQMAIQLAEQLALLDPEGAALYRGNASKWKLRMDNLTERINEIGQHLRPHALATQYSVFDYLLKDASLSSAVTIHAHAGHDPSAGTLLSVAEKMKNSKTSYLLLEPAYLPRVGRILKRETGASVVSLETGVSSRDEDNLDAYEELMRGNVKQLEKIFATD